jgi:hypothetical protein
MIYEPVSMEIISTSQVKIQTHIQGQNQFVIVSPFNIHYTDIQACLT